jgi:hypothetical protein
MTHISGGRNGAEFSFLVFLCESPFRHLSPPPETCVSPEQAAHYHILGVVSHSGEEVTGRHREPAEPSQSPQDTSAQLLTGYG